MKQCYNVIGQRFGMLVVLELCNHLRPNSYRGYYWKCKCDCGAECYIYGIYLRSRKTPNCGCYTKTLYATNKGKISPSRKPEGISRANKVFNTYKLGAKRRNISFDLSFEIFLKLTTDQCYYCGSPPTNICTSRHKHNGDYIYNGIDRLNNKLGYSIENCVTACKNCNLAKRDMDLEEFKVWLTNIYKHWMEKER